MKTCVSLMLGILGSLATLASSADIISDGLNMLPTTGDYFLYDTLKEAVATASPLLSFPLRLSPGLFRFTGEISTVGMKCPGVGVKFRLILKDLSPDVCTLQGYNLRQKRAVIMREMELDNGQYEVLNSNDANVFELPISTDGFRSSFSTVIKIDGVEDEQREATLELVAEPEAWKEGNECLSSESYPIVSLGHLRFSEVDEALSDIPCGQSMISFQHDPTKHILPFRFGKTLLGGSRPTILSKDSLLLKETEPYQIQLVVPVVPKRL
ncbi:hypothetical protein BKA69DRAFT_1098973 [Paraphysoderma sedebokerense]|nr:hypothetical protein BKA69DRAFT_1098973 [Paraphysoderma sedebokerense]